MHLQRALGLLLVALASIASAADLVSVPSTIRLQSLPGGTATTQAYLVNPNDFAVSMRQVLLGCDLGGWETTGLWHTTARKDGDGDTGAWYFGREDTGTYDTGARASGDLTSPSFVVANPRPSFSFLAWRATEGNAARDVPRAQISTNGGTTWSDLAVTIANTSRWESYSVSLASYVGQTARVRLLLDTIDATANAFEGVYVDRLRVNGTPVRSWLKINGNITFDSTPGGIRGWTVLTATSAGLAEGVHRARMRLESFDARVQSSEIPVEFLVARRLPPIVGITGQEFGGSAPFTVRYNGSTSSDPDGGPLTYAWAFGDGASAIGVDGTHRYDLPGVWRTRLTVTDADGLSAWATVPGTALQAAGPSRAIFAATIPATAPWTVALDARGSHGIPWIRGYKNSPPHPNDSTWRWDFGDGTTGSGDVTSHTYTAPGTYSIQLTYRKTPFAFDPPVTTTFSAVVGGSNQPPIARIATSTQHGPGTSYGIGPLTVRFDATSSSDPDGSIAAYEWQFGDGGTAVGAVASYTYTWVGVNIEQCPVATLTVTDDRGVRSSTTMPIIVGFPSFPTVTFGANPRSGVSPLTVAFDASSTVDAYSMAQLPTPPWPQRFHWDFGDGTSADGATVSHQYGAAGTYVARLGYTDAAGWEYGTSHLIVVAPGNTAPVARIAVAPPSAPAPALIAFDGSASSDADGSALTYAWSFGDGSVATGATVSHRYDVPGAYTATLIVTDAQGATGTAVSSVTITSPNQAPQASATATPSTGVAPLAVVFDGTGSTDADGVIASYAWTFGDGANGAGATASHTYAAAGNYTATLTVTDDDGATAQTTVAITATAANQAPVALATATPSTGIAPLAVVFDGAASTDADGAIASYAWTFGDGTNGTGATAAHTYAAAGNYTATLTVTDDDGATAQTTVAITVTAANQAPLALATATPSTGVAPLAVAFDGTGSTDSDGVIASFAWAFGDGANAAGPTASHTYAAAGTYIVTLTVADDMGAIGSVARTITVTSPSDVPIGWVAPVASGDAEARWDFEADAFDGNRATYAQDTSNRLGYGAWLQLDLPAAIAIDRLRVNADFGYGAVDAVDIDVRVGGVWLDAYEGVVANAADTDLAIAPVVADAVRFRFHYNATGYWFWLYELQVFHAAPVVTPPAVATLSATSVWPEAAVLHARVDDSGGAPAEVRFEYGTTTAYGATTPWAGALAGGDTIAARIPSGLVAGTTYHARAQARNASGAIAYGSDISFTPGPVTTTSWMAPTAAAASTWLQTDSAIDDELGSAARAFHDLWSELWSPYLELGLPPSRATAVRFTAARGPEVDGIQVDVRRDGSWQTVHDGVFPDGASVEAVFEPAVVDAVRIRMHIQRAEVGQFWELYQVQVRVEPTAINAPPTVAIAAQATPNPVTGFSTALAVLGEDNAGEETLSYHWSVEAGAPGVVVFSDNDRNSAKIVDASFAHAGAYTLLATIRDAQGLVATSGVAVAVQQTVTSIGVLPASGLVQVGGALQFTATIADQFGDAISTPPPFVWSVADPGEGGDGISSSGLFTAGNVAHGPVGISASVGGVSGAAVVAVSPGTTTNQPPTLANLTATPVTGTSATLSANADDDGGEPLLTYSWSVVSAAGSASFARNGDNAARDVVVSFGAAGAYVLRCVVRDAEGAAVEGTIDVLVDAVTTAIQLTPASIGLPPGATQQFAAVVLDQFGTAMATNDGIAWATSAGSIDADGALVVAVEAAGKHVVVASSRGITATARVIVRADPAPMVMYMRSSPSEGELLGAVPRGTSIVAIEAAGFPADLGFAAEIVGDVFRASVTNGSSVASAIVTLRFVFAGGRVGPATTWTLPFGDGGGGDWGNGDAEALRPVVRDVRVRITGGTTGIHEGAIGDLAVSYTKNEAVEVTVTASAAIGAIADLDIVLGDGRVVSAAGNGVPTVVPVPAEGLLTIRGRAVAVKGYQRMSRDSDPVHLLVDRSPLGLEPRGALSSPAGFVPEALPNPTAGYVFLNDNAEAEPANGNAAQRGAIGSSVYRSEHFSLDVSVIDASGIDPAKATFVARRQPSGPDKSLTVSVEEVQGDPTSQRLVVTGLSSLEEAVYVVRSTAADRAGVESTVDLVRILVDRTKPTLSGSSGWTTPARFYANANGSGAAVDVADVWQEEIGPRNHLILTDIGWLLPREVPVSHVGALPVHLVARDYAGNMATGDPGFALLSGLNVVSGYSIYLNQTTVLVRDADRATTTRDSVQWWETTGWSPYEPSIGPRYTQHPGIPGRANLSGKHDFIRRIQSAVATRPATTEHVPTNPQSDGSGFYAYSLAYSVVPLDPGADDAPERRFGPAVISCPPSWATETVYVPLRIRDPGIAQATASGGLLPGCGPSSSYVRVGARQVLASNGESDDQLVADLPLTRSGVESLSPGWQRIQYSAVPAELPAYTNPYGFRWSNLVKLENDVVPVGSRQEIAIVGGFLDHDFAIEEFDPLGDYVRFVSPDGDDITIGAASWPSVDPADPATRRKIAIASQRLVCRDHGLSQRQRLEVQVLVGSDVEAALYSVDVKCGGVKECADELSQENATWNLDENGDRDGKSWPGAHRMRAALAVAAIDWMVPDADGRPQATDVLLTSNPRPTIAVPYLPTASQASIDATGRVSLRLTGTVDDPYADMVKGGEADHHEVIVASDGVEIARLPLTRVGEPPSLFAEYAHHYVFDAEVAVPTRDGAEVTISTAPNAFGNIGRYHFAISVRTNEGAINSVPTWNLHPIDTADVALAEAVELWRGDAASTVRALMTRVATHTDGTIAFEGALDGHPLRIQARQTTQPDPAVVDQVDVAFALAPEDAVFFPFVESGVTTGSYRYRGVPRPRPASPELIAIQALGADAPGAFHPIAVRIRAPDVIMSDPTVTVGGNDFLAEKKVDGDWWVTGSDVHVFVISDNNPQLLKPPKPSERYLIPKDNNTAKVKQKGNVARTAAIMTVTEVLHGDHAVPVTLEIKDPPLTFAFQKGDGFIVNPGAKALSPTSISVDESKPKDSPKWASMTGPIADVSLPAGKYPLQVTTNGKVATFPDAFIVHQRVHLVVNNTYGEMEMVSAQQGVDDYIRASGAALALDLQAANPDDRVEQVTMSKPGTTGWLWSILGDRMTSTAEDGRGLRPESVVALYTLGHGSMTIPDEGVAAIHVNWPNRDGSGTMVHLVHDVVQSDGNPDTNDDDADRVPAADFVSRWQTLLARNQPTTITLYHCFAGMYPDFEQNSVHAIASSLHAVGINNVTTIGWDDVVSFAQEVDGNGKETGVAIAPQPSGNRLEVLSGNKGD